MVSSPPARENGDVILCPGSLFSLTCTHDNVRAEQTRWEILNYGLAPLIPRVASHEPDTDKSESLGPFNFTMISDGSGPTLTSTVEATVTESLNGTVVLCRDGGSSNSTIVGRVTVRVVGMSLSADSPIYVMMLFTCCSPAPRSILKRFYFIYQSTIQVLHLCLQLSILLSQQPLEESGSLSRVMGYLGQISVTVLV